MNASDSQEPPRRQAITGLILAGGRGSRMGGADKGLQNFNGVPLALHALRRLSPQVGNLIISANRNLAAYASFGVPAWPDSDSLGRHAGPLAGFLTGLEHCATPYLLTVPCDTPLFPQDLAARMAEALARENAELAVAAAPEDGGLLRPQPVFCLMGAAMLESLRRYTEGGGRKIAAWTARHRTAIVPFDRPGDAAHGFFNANTLAELHQLESNQP